MLLYPAAKIPVVALSVCPQRDAAWHFALGRALAPLRAAGLLVIGSGALTHQRYAVQPPVGHDVAPDWVDAFADWMGQRLAERDEAARVGYREQAPQALDNHPGTEHLRPLFVALGAAGPDSRASLLHRSVTCRALRMDAFRVDA